MLGHPSRNLPTFRADLLRDTVEDYQQDRRLSRRQPLPVLCEQVEAKIENTFATGIHRNRGAVYQEVNTAVVKAIKHMISDMQVDSAIRRATRQTS